MDPLAQILSDKATELFQMDQPFTTTPLPPLPDTAVPAASMTPLSPQALGEVRSTLIAMKQTIDRLLGMLQHTDDTSTATPISIPRSDEGTRIIMGTFNGEKMIGSDGNLYMVPPNYASKSKLVDGDTLKLTITPNGALIYKQVTPIERNRLAGTLTKHPVTGHWAVTVTDKLYRVLTASVTFHKGQLGDEVFFLVPKEKETLWGAVEYIIKKTPTT